MSVANSVEKHPESALQNAELNRFITFRIARLHAKLNIQASKLLMEHANLSLTQWRIISLLGTFGQTNSAELVRASAMDKGLLSRRLKSLIKDGLVIAMVDQSDSRVHPLRLSAKGQDIYDTTLPVMRRRQAKIRAMLSETQAEQLFEIFEQLDQAAEIHEFD